MSASVRIAQADYDRLRRHLFRPDHDEHAAFLFAGEMQTSTGSRRLVRQIVEVPDHAFGPSDRGGYRQVAANEVARAAMYCHQHGLQLMWAHSHPARPTTSASACPTSRPTSAPIPAWSP